MNTDRTMATIAAVTPKAAMASRSQTTWQTRAQKPETVKKRKNQRARKTGELTRRRRLCEGAADREESSAHVPSLLPRPARLPGRAPRAAGAGGGGGSGGRAPGGGGDPPARDRRRGPRPPLHEGPRRGLPAGDEPVRHRGPRRARLRAAPATAG